MKRDHRGDKSPMKEKSFGDNKTLNWSIGIDIVDVNRFRQYPPNEHPRFYERCFKDQEMKHCLKYSADPFPHFAGLFAAKEAVFKALNRFINVRISNIMVLHDNKGKPMVYLVDSENDHVKLLERENDAVKIEVAISHSLDLAIAWAVVLKANAANGDEDASIDVLKNILDNSSEVNLDEFLGRIYKQAK